MIPVQGVTGQTVAVLGLGRSGRATAAALVAGGADVGFGGQRAAGAGAGVASAARWSAASGTGKRCTARSAR